MKPKKLSDLRREIDKLDIGIMDLINKRGKIGCEIGEIKKKKNQPQVRCPQPDVFPLERQRKKHCA